MTKRLPLVLAVSLLSCTLLSFGAIANANPPTLEIYYSLYQGSDCAEHAEAALSKAGFEAKKGTFQAVDHVGVKGDYKGVVSCLNNKNMSAKDTKFVFLEAPGQTTNIVMFMVAGPVYKEANQSAMALKQAFEAP